jgi:hypothetical protein
VWNGFIYLVYGSVADCSKHGNELSGSMKGKEFIERLSNYCPFKKDSAPWR